jgi:CDP-diacylglycerol--glycerol-3-phosphate 3-phosphatidyltransferase
MKLNLPNKISLIRICMIPAFIVVFLYQFSYNYIVAAAIFALAAATDFLDGYIARKYKLVTNLGKFLDPIADKVLVATAFILMLTAKSNLFGVFGNMGEIIYLCVAVSVCLILARELIISAFRQIAATQNVVMAADMTGKIKTCFQDVALIVMLISCQFVGKGFFVYFFYAGLSLLVIATLLTIISAINYIVKNKAVLKN